MAGESVSLIKCTSCSAPLQIHAPGQTLSVACAYCGAVLDLSNSQYQILSKAREQIKIEPVIPLGKKGKLRGQVWQVIGFMERSDATTVYRWREYLLFNPARGFRWLTEQNGHWNYVLMTKDRPRRSLALQSHKASYLNKEYDLFEKGQAQVLFVLGEFYWRVKVGERVEIEDYISPPEMLSLEKNSDEQIWSLAEYVPAAEISKAFEIETSQMPLVQGIAPNQPRVYDEKITGLGTYWAFFASMLVLFQFGSCLRAENKSAYSDGFQFRLDEPAKTAVTQPFQLSGGTGNVEIHLSSPVSNNWFSVQAELVNDNTGETYEFEQGVEYYWGTDSDGSWSEGSQSSEHLISAVPPGTYHLNLEPTAGRPSDWSAGSFTTYQLTVRRDVPTYSNFFWALALISLLPSVVLWKNRSFESRRWANSDYSPYLQMEDNE